MKTNTLPSPKQQFNYSRIPNFVLETSDLSYSEKKILLFAFAIQVHEHVPLVNLVKGWSKDKTLNSNVRIPSQLRSALKSLEQKGFIERIHTRRKLTAIRVNIDLPSIASSKFFFLTKQISSCQFLSLDNIANMCAYARFHHTNTIYTTKLASILGVTVKTFRKHNTPLIKLKFLQAEAPKRTVYTNKHAIITYRMVKELYIENHTRKNIKHSFHNLRDDFYPLKIYFLKKIKNNVTMQGILRMEKRNSSKQLQDYLAFSQHDEAINSIQTLLMQSGKYIEKTVLKRQILQIMLEKSKNNNIRFVDKRSFFLFMVRTLNPKDDHFNFDPLKYDFIQELTKFIPFCLPTLIINEEIKGVLDAGFKFKDWNHALKFFVNRFSKKTYSTEIREQGVQEKCSRISSENSRGSIFKLGDILKGLMK